MMFFFKAFVTKNHQNPILYSIIDLFLPPYFTPNLSYHSILPVKIFGKIAISEKTAILESYAQWLNPLIFSSNQA